MARSKNLLLSSVLIAILTGCQNNNNNTKHTEPLSSITINGKVIDGYISNSLVYLDTNNNNKLDKDEPETYSDVNGNYSLTFNDSDFKNKNIIAEGGIDTNSGLKFNGILKSPIKNNKIINLNPLTTLLSFELENDNNYLFKSTTLSKIFGIKQTDIYSDITKKSNVYKKALIIQKLFDIAQIYSENKEEVIELMKIYTKNLNGNSDYNSSIDLLKSTIINKYDIDTDILDYIVENLKKQTVQLNMDLIVNILRKNYTNKYIPFSIDKVKEEISDLMKEDLTNTVLNNLKKKFNKYGYDLNEKKYNFYLKRYPEFKNIKFVDIEQEINSIKDAQFKEFIKNIIKEK